MAAIPHHLLGPGRPLVYVLRFGDEVYGHQWTVDQGLDAHGLRTLEFLVELDPSVVGHGGSTISVRSLLVCDDELRPLRYESASGSRRVVLRLEADELSATLPDGESLTIEHESAPVAVLEANMVAHQALLAADANPDDATAQSCPVLLVNQLLVMSYALTRAPELDEAELTGWRSSFKEELWLDARGGLVRWRQPAQSISAELMSTPVALPEWVGEAPPAPPTVSYERPGGATFALHDVTIAGPVTPIGGALTLPAGEGPHPAALFLSGSGRHDRHGIAGEIDVGTHQIMDGLAERGIIGLRCDSRGAGTTKLGSDVLEQGLQTLFDDAGAALETLCGRPEVGGRPVWLIGHSQGAIVALALARSRPESVAGVVLLAAPGRAIDALMEEQVEALGLRRGLSAQQVATQLADLREFVHAVRDGRSWSENSVPAHVLAGARSRRWLEEHLRFRTDELLAGLSKPVLLCQGGKDLQVSPERDADRLRSVAAETGVDMQYTLFPELDHLFKEVEGEPDPKQYFDAGRRVDPALIDRIAAWIDDVSAAV
ncbi:MAG: alpha/beta fold hydrolase [Nannocystaceae bacterium]